MLFPKWWLLSLDRNGVVKALAATNPDPDGRIIRSTPLGRTPFLFHFSTFFDIGEFSCFFLPLTILFTFCWKNVPILTNVPENLSHLEPGFFSTKVLCKFAVLYVFYE